MSSATAPEMSIAEDRDAAKTIVRTVSDRSQEPPIGSQILVQVADVLDSSGKEEVRARVVKSLVESELSKRTNTLVDALSHRSRLQGAVEECKPPAGKKMLVLGADGKACQVENPVYTPEEMKKYEEELKAHQKKKKEASDKLGKFDRLLETALSAPTKKAFEDLTAGM
jgi:hypothetical protein